MIVKVLYSLGGDLGNLYLCKTPSLKIQDVDFRVFKVRRPGSTKPMILGFFGLRKCLELAVQHSPELFDFERALEPKLRVTDYSVYHKDALEDDTPLVGHGSMREILLTQGEEGIAGVILKKPGFLSGESDEETPEIYGLEECSEEDATAYLRNNNYSLEVRLEFKRFFRNYNAQYDSRGQQETQKSVAKPSKKVPKASRTLSLPVFDQSMADDIFELFYSGPQMELRNIKAAPKKKKKPAKPKKVVAAKPGPASEFEDLPETPMCVHCSTERSTQWRWHKSEKKEGLVCRECSDYYRKHYKLRPLEKKTKKRKSTSSAVASPMPSKKRALGSISIAESLSAKRDLLQQQKSASPAVEGVKSPSHVRTPTSHVRTPTGHAPIEPVLEGGAKSQDQWISQMLTKLTPDVRSPADENFGFDETFDILNFEGLFAEKPDSDQGSNAKTDESEPEGKPLLSSMPSSPIEGKL